MKTALRFGCLWLAMWFGAVFLAGVNTLHTFSSWARYSIFACLVVSAGAFFLAFIGSRVRK